MRITSSTESFAESTVDRYCCCASEVAPPTSTSIFTFGFFFWYSSAILRITSGRCWPPVKMRKLVCADAAAAKPSASEASTIRLKAFIENLLSNIGPRLIVSSSGIYYPPLTHSVHSAHRSPIIAAERQARVRIEQVKSVEIERNAQRLAGAQSRVGGKAAGNLILIGVGRHGDRRRTGRGRSQPDTTERVRAQRLDQDHRRVDDRVRWVAGIGDRNVLGSQPEDERPPAMPRAFFRSRTGHGQIDAAR